MPMRHKEQHRLESISWLRAAVLGANDGIVSTASLVAGVASARRSWKRRAHGRGRHGCWGYVDGDGGIRIGFLAGGY
jgi:hypothetical protein